MDEDKWWEQYRTALLGLPRTSEDSEVLIDLLSTAGYFEPRSGLPRPADHCPRRAAKAAYRLRFEAPVEARTAARAWLAEHGGGFRG